eukprot:scaffold1551_cov77-Isochrysis_galbana.AAC.3
MQAVAAGAPMAGGPEPTTPAPSEAGAPPPSSPAKAEAPPAGPGPAAACPPKQQRSGSSRGRTGESNCSRGEDGGCSAAHAVSRAATHWRHAARDAPGDVSTDV